MKITCPSCSARYTIADEKIRGRTVKIRCKKCNTPTIIRGTDLDGAAQAPHAGQDPSAQAAVPGPVASPEAMQVEWLVTLDDGSQQSGNAEVIRGLYQAGSIHENTYVWRDGMADWQVLSQTPELWALVQQAGAGGALAAGAVAPSMSNALFGQGGQAARVDPGKQYNDIFSSHQEAAQTEAAPAQAHEDPFDHAKPAVPRFTAERNENSVLFTIDSILSAGKGPAKKAPAPIDDDKVDFRRIATTAPIDNDASDYGPSAAFGRPSLAPPALPTTLEPEPPPPAPAVSDLTALDIEKPKSNRGLIYGLGAALVVLLLVIIGGGIYMFNRQEEMAANSAEAAAAKARLEAEVEAKAKAAAEEAKREEERKQAEKEREAKEAKEAKEKEELAKAEKNQEEEEKAANSDKGSSGDSSKAFASAAGGAKTGGSKTSDTSKNTKDTKPKQTASASEPAATKTETPAASGDRSFSRSAAVSALNSAAASASSCKKPDGPTGRGKVSVTFAPSGRVTSANVGGAFAGTAVGGCVAGVFRRAKVPPFDGSPVTVSKSFTIN